MKQQILAEKARFLGECYITGDTAYKECPMARYEINELNKIIYTFGNNPVYANETVELPPEHFCKYCQHIKDIIRYKKLQ